MKKTLLIFSLTILSQTTLKAQPVNGIIYADTANITVVKVWGTHYERGYACGFLLHSGIRALYEGYLVPKFGTYLPVAKSIIQQGVHISIDQKFVDEAQGMLDGITAAGEYLAGVDYLDMLVANSYLDLQGFTSKELGLSHGCSSLLSWGGATLNTELYGRSVISRHLDWEPDTAIVNNQVIVVHFPSEPDEQPWLLIGFAGQMSVLSGLNNAGVCAFQNMMSDFYGSPDYYMGYEPIWFSIRKGMETYDFNGDNYNDTYDIRDALAANTNGYADGYIVEALAPSIAGEDSLVAIIAELAAQDPLIVFRGNEYADSIPGDNLYAANYEIKRNDHRHYCSRYYGVIGAIGNGKGIGAEENWAIMRDHSNSSWSNIQFMQVVPEDRILRIAVHDGITAAFLLDSVEFSLDELFDMPTGTGRTNSRNISTVTVFPHPVSDKATIAIHNVNMPAAFTLYDINGRTADEITNIRSDRFEFDRKGLPSGVYFFRINNSSGDYGTNKLLLY
ncbi:MAG: T9SS type A sorting domain-containing protein [Bacteroidetes bacterium]|nr:T9SS type A sorting domain-containing protein [Bacteroidota bacterium]